MHQFLQQLDWFTINRANFFIENTSFKSSSSKWNILFLRDKWNNIHFGCLVLFQFLFGNFLFLSSSDISSGRWQKRNLSSLSLDLKSKLSSRKFLFIGCSSINNYSFGFDLTRNNIVIWTVLGDNLYIL